MRNKTLTELTGVRCPSYVDGLSLVPWLKDPSLPREQPAYITWGRGNYSIRTRDWRYTRYFEDSEELYHNARDPKEWKNLAASTEHTQKKEELAGMLPENEAPLVLSGKALHNVVDADRPDMKVFKKLWKETNAKIKPPLE